MNVIEVKVPSRPAFIHITQAEEMLVHYFQGTLGSGYTVLYNCIFKLDISNRIKMAKGFPNEVEVCNRWNNEPGYSSDLEQRYNKEYNTQISI